MPAKNLTDAFVKSAEPLNGKLTEFSDTKERGLCLRVTSSGAKSWTYRYRLLSGKQKRMSLGKTDDVSLSAARRIVVKHRASIAEGGDPALDVILLRNEAKEAKNRETIQEIGEWYYQECDAGRHTPNARGPKRPSTLRVERPYFDRMIVNGIKELKIAGLGKLKLTTLPRATIEEFLNKLNDKKSASAARHCRVVLHSLFEFAIWKEVTDRNPCRGVVKRNVKARERVLSDEELKIIWDTLLPPNELEGLTVSPPVAYGILLAMVTLQRRSEVSGIHLSEISFEQKIWTIPGTRTKNHRTHVVPLSKLAIDIIEKALQQRTWESGFLFPSPLAKENNDKPIDGQALTRAFIRMRELLKLNDMRPHDLRRTGATNLTGEQLGFSRFIVSKILNHTSDTGGAAITTSVYDRNDYISDKRRALNAWADRLMDIANDMQSQGKVIPFVRP